MSRIKEIRDKLGFSQQDFADKIDSKRHKIADIESGKQKVPVEIAEKIEEIFHINPWWILTGKGEMFINETKPEQSTPANTLNSHIADREMEIVKAFRELSAEKQEVYYYKIKLEAAEERIKNQEQEQDSTAAKYA